LWSKRECDDKVRAKRMREGEDLMVTVTIHCLHCGSDELKRNGCKHYWENELTAILKHRSLAMS